jgi:hypothetical protein
MEINQNKAGGALTATLTGRLDTNTRPSCKRRSLAQSTGAFKRSKST